METFLTAIVFIVCCSVATAQTNSSQDSAFLVLNGKDTVYNKVEITPTYPGGILSWQRYLRMNLRYPDGAMEKSIQGDITVQFIIDTVGKVSNIKFVDGNLLLAEEGIRLIK